MGKEIEIENVLTYRNLTDVRRESERELEKFSSRAVRMNGVLKKTGVIRYLMQIALCDSPMYEENISIIVVTGAV